MLLYIAQCDKYTRSTQVLLDIWGSKYDPAGVKQLSGDDESEPCCLLATRYIPPASTSVSMSIWWRTKKRRTDCVRRPLRSSRHCGQTYHRGLYVWRSANNFKGTRGIEDSWWSVEGHFGSDRHWSMKLKVWSKSQKDDRSWSQLGRLKTWRWCRWMMRVDVSNVVRWFTRPSSHTPDSLKTDVLQSDTGWDRDFISVTSIYHVWKTPII